MPQTIPLCVGFSNSNTIQMDDSATVFEVRVSIIKKTHLDHVCPHSQCAPPRTDVIVLVH